MFSWKPGVNHSSEKVKRLQYQTAGRKTSNKTFQYYLLLLSHCQDVGEDAVKLLWCRRLEELFQQ